MLSVAVNMFVFSYFAFIFLSYEDALNLHLDFCAIWKNIKLS